MEDDTVALCIMPSPLPEAVRSYLLTEEDHPLFPKLPEDIKLLAPTDSFMLVFSDSKYQFAFRRSYWEKVNDLRQAELLKLEIANRTRR